LLSGVYPLVFWVIILPNQGGKRSVAATKGSGVCSIELMAAALRRTATHVISRPMACREAARHRLRSLAAMRCLSLIQIIVMTKAGSLDPISCGQVHCLVMLNFSWL